MILCEVDTVVLRATLTDHTNTRNHTFYWEQMSGVPIVLSSTDEVSTSYSYVENSNKRFRFYLDYGTNKEQYKDVEVFHTPTSVINSSVSDGTYSSINQTIPNYELTPDYTIPTDLLSYAPADTSPATRIDYDEVSSLLKHDSIKMEIFTNAGIFTHDPQELYATYTKHNYPYSLILPKGVYKFVFHYLIDGNYKKYVSPLIVSFPKVPEGTDMVYVNDVIITEKAIGRLTPISLIRYAHTRKDVQWWYTKASKSIGNVTPESVVRYSRTIKDIHDSDVIAGISGGELYAITRFNSSGIGS